jgi:hypothetical protein
VVLACSDVSPQMFGPLREVTVVSPYWDKVELPVRAILQQPIMTPQPEPEFKLRVGKPEKFDTYYRFRIVFLIGTPRDTLVRQILGTRADSMSEGDFGLLKVPNPWFKGQHALILLARDTAKLVTGLTAYAARIRQTLREIVFTQMSGAVFIEGVNQSKFAPVARRYAFTIDVPRRWLVDDEYAEQGFVCLYGHFPDRSVFVHWEEKERSLDPDSLYALRDGLTGRFYNGDSIDRQFLTADTIGFLSVPCLRQSGVWRNSRETIGGPFVNYSFNFRGRFFMLDGLVYDPGKKKLDPLTQAEVVLRTFTPQ